MDHDFCARISQKTPLHISNLMASGIKGRVGEIKEQLSLHLVLYRGWEKEKLNLKRIKKDRFIDLPLFPHQFGTLEHANKGKN